MKKIVLKPYWNFEKEQSWLNHMAEQGWALCDYSWFKYTFEPCEKGEYVYYIDLLNNMYYHAKSKAFIEIVEQTGITHVASYMRWVYFRKKADGNPFELYTDLDSKIMQLQRINRFWSILSVSELAIGLSNFTIWVSAGAERQSLSLISGLLLIAIGVLLLTVVYPVRIKIKSLIKEKQITE